VLIQPEEKNMKLRLVVVCLAALVLAGCGLFGGHHGRGDCSKCQPLDNTRPQVSVVNGKVMVDQDTLRFGEGLRNVPVTITWVLPKGSNLRFPSNGIVFEKSADGEIVCNAEGGTTFRCLNRHTKPGRYKYEIRVLEGDKALPPLDPHVVND
jgi:hypothetical protein